MNEAELDTLKELVAASEAVVRLNHHPGRPENTHTVKRPASHDFILLSRETWYRFHLAIETSKLLLYPSADVGFGSPK